MEGAVYAENQWLIAKEKASWKKAGIKIVEGYENVAQCQLNGELKGGKERHGTDGEMGKSKIAPKHVPAFHSVLHFPRFASLQVASGSGCISRCMSGEVHVWLVH